MARLLNRLNDRAISSAKIRPGRHADGGGLYLESIAGRKGRGQALGFLYRKDGRLREMGLGGLLNVPLSTARAEAEKWRQFSGPRQPRRSDRRARSHLGHRPDVRRLRRRFVKTKGKGGGTRSTAPNGR